MEHFQCPLNCGTSVLERVSIVDQGVYITTYTHAATSSLKLLVSVYHSALKFINGDPYGTYHCVLYNNVVWSSLALWHANYLYLLL